MSFSGNIKRIVISVIAFIIVALLITNIRTIYLDCIFKTLLPPYSISELDKEDFDLKAVIKQGDGSTHLTAKIKLSDTTEKAVKLMLKINYDVNINSVEYFQDYSKWWNATDSQVEKAYVHYTDRKVLMYDHGVPKKNKVPFCSMAFIVKEKNELYLYLVHFI